MAIKADNIFVNLPVKDVKNSMEFFSAIGFEFNMQFSDEQTACLLIGENLFAMIMTEERFKQFTKKEIPDTATNAQAIMAIGVQSKDLVDEIVDKALANGASFYNEPQDLGFMYSRSFQDLDNHLWEVLYMDLTNTDQ
ncbi:VOC family protein [Psychrobacillus vulpis]|uniref:Glyoxalase/bleomycin resistance/extradiol dioxygenase family protein n=1 Tax=Psychrobacillus vulpis TaxID=2325572 RepID=A0A544TQJ3_9BACI|nr:VOC family protein [Psychrobacillus vulpis]TQR19719.1 glyoxalase/bleomycin resistance/extradiol dioxygenase family protein [Psychrobacillus vulpis]